MGCASSSASEGKCSSARDHQAVDIVVYRQTAGKTEIAVMPRRNPMGSSFVRCAKEGKCDMFEGMKLEGDRCVKTKEEGVKDAISKVIHDSGMVSQIQEKVVDAQKQVTLHWKSPDGTKSGSSTCSLHTADVSGIDFPAVENLKWLSCAEAIDEDKEGQAELYKPVAEKMGCGSEAKPAPVSSASE